jgi:hypothetical protein
MIALTTMAAMDVSHMHPPTRPSRGLSAGLTPEEDAIGDPDEQGDEIDDLLPANLWFHAHERQPQGVTCS